MHRQIAGKLTSPVTKWIVLVLVLGATVAMAFLGTKLGEVKNNEATSWLPGSAESTKVADELSQDVNPNDIPTLVVYHRASGLTTADFAAMDEHAEEINAIDGVTDAGVLTPNAARALETAGENVPTLVSDDGQVAYSYFVFNFGKDGWNKIPDPAKEIRALVEIDGVETYLGGFGGQASDFASSFEGSQNSLILVTLGVVILILLFTYRSPILWLLPIISAVVAFFMSQGVVYLLARYADLTVNDQSEYILGILVIGAGTDYALLLIARYREELRTHEDRHEAMGYALHRAAPAIIASAATVVIGLMCLTFADLNSTAGLGPVLAAGVAVTLLVMITLLPALLVIVGRWIFWPKRPSFGSDEPTSHGLWARLGSRIERRPRAIWASTAALLAIACFGMVQLNATGLSTEDSFTSELSSVTAQKLLIEHGVYDNSNTVQVVANDAEAAEIAEKVTAVEGVGKASDLKPLGNGRSWFEAGINEDVSSPAAFDLVREVRNAAHGVEGGDARVGGGAALYLDTKIASDRDNKVIMPIVLLVVFLILVVLLRALLAPLLLMVTVVLSFGAALGISSLLFHYVFDFAGTDPGFPLFAFVFLVALGIDYNIFLMTRVREETARYGTRKGSLIALSSTGGVITSAGLVLAATFAMLGTLPFVFLVELATAVAIGVLLDTMIVRSVLVTALNLDLGGKIWWPSKLDRDPEITAADETAPEAEAGVPAGAV